MKQLKLWLVITLIFAAGFAAGVVTTRGAARHIAAAAINQPELARMHVERELVRKLRLDDKQRAQARQVLNHTHSQLKELRQDTQPRLHGILKQARHDLSEILTLEQRERFRKYLEAHPLPTNAFDSPVPAPSPSLELPPSRRPL
jgi:hypothetical protein